VSLLQLQPGAGGAFLEPRQRIAPSADVITTGWSAVPNSPSSLYDKIDEDTTSTDDYIFGRAQGDPSAAVAVVAQAPRANSIAREHKVRYCIGVAPMLVELREGATLIAQWPHAAPLPYEPITFEQVLTEAQRSAITNYNALRLYFVAGHPGGAGVPIMFVSYAS
jgi:hypothetical protein